MAGDVVDIMTSGEIVDLAGSGITGLAAGQPIYCTPAGDLTNVLTGNTKVGYTVEANRMIVRVAALAKRLPYVMVDSYGAVGDGTADDTAAIKAAITAAGVGGVIYFTPGKTYIASALLRMLAGQTWMGYGATLKRRNGITTTTTTAIAIGDGGGAGKVLTLASTTGLAVGMEVTVTTGPNNTDGDYNSHPIQAIDHTAKTINVGIPFIKAFPAGGTVVTHHGIISGPLALGGDFTLGVKGGDDGTADCADGCRVLGLTIDGNRANNTGYAAWQTSFSLGMYSDGGVVADCRIINSVADGIILGGQGATARSNIILRSGGNAIHLSGLGGGKVTGNYCKDANLANAPSGGVTWGDPNSGAAHSEGLMTWSAAIYDTLVDGNYFENGRAIFGGIGFGDNSNNIISNNVGIGGTAFAIEANDNNGAVAVPLGNMVITGNRFRDCGGNGLSFNNSTSNAGTETYGSPVERVTIANNELINTKLTIFRGKGFAVTGNRFVWTAAVVAFAKLMELDRCTDVTVKGNLFRGGYTGLGISSSAPAAGATKWLIGSGILVEGNTLRDQLDGGITVASVNGFAYRACTIKGNIVVTTTAQAAGYVGIYASSGWLVEGNNIDIANNRGIRTGGDIIASPTGIPGTVVVGNYVRTPGESIRIDGGIQSVIVVRNFITTAVSNAGGAGNTVTDNVILVA